MTTRKENTVEIFVTHSFKSILLNTSDQSFTEEYKPQLLNSNDVLSIQHLPICLIKPKFQYIPYSEKIDFKILRGHQTFLSSKTIQKIETIRQSQQFASRFHKNSLFDESYDSPSPSKSSNHLSNHRVILILYIRLENLLSSNNNILSSSNPS